MDAFIYSFQPTFFDGFEATITLDELLATHIDGAIAVTKDNTSASADEENTGEEDEEEKEKGGEDDEEG